MNEIVTKNELGAALAALIPESPLAAFAPGQMERTLSAIRDRVMAEPIDITTDAGRKRIASVAYAIVRSKTALDKAGKEIASDIAAQRKLAVTFLDNLKEDFRRPLTEWEEAEERRCAKHKAGIHAAFVSLGVSANSRSDEIRAVADTVHAAPVDAGVWEEFSVEAIAAKQSALAQLDEMLKTSVSREELEAENARIRAEAEAAKKVAAEAAAKLEAENTRLRAEAEAAAKIARQAEDVRLAEEYRARQAEHAKQAEAQRIEAERLRAEREQAAREQDELRRAAVHNEILSALLQAGISEIAAGIVVEAITTGRIPHLRIEY